MNSLVVPDRNVCTTSKSLEVANRDGVERMSRSGVITTGRGITCDEDAGAVVQAGRDVVGADDVVLGGAVGVGHRVQGPGDA